MLNMEGEYPKVSLEKVSAFIGLTISFLNQNESENITEAVALSSGDTTDENMEKIEDSIPINFSGKNMNAPNVACFDAQEVASDESKIILEEYRVYMYCGILSTTLDEHLRETHGDVHPNPESVTVITGGETLSAFEEGLADDDSWVENISHDEEDFGPSSITEDSSSGEEVTLTCSVAVDNEDELRGYHRAAIDFTLHTIVEESCEESEVEQTCSIKKPRPASATDLEKYFFFGLGDGNIPSISTNRDDAFSETSSVYSEGLDSFGGPEELQQPNDHSDSSELASSRLEKYFLSGFMGFNAERRDSDCSVGSDSEGRPSPEQRRKRLVRARGTGRSHSSSLDNLISNPELSGNDQPNEASSGSENSSSSDSDTYDETTTFDKGDGQFDTVKRKKSKKQKSNDELKSLETTQEVNEENISGEEDEDGHKTPQPDITLTTNLVNNRNQQSRDSGFIGSCDDLLKEQRDTNNSENSNKNEMKIELENIIEEKKEEKHIQQSVPPATALTRKDSFNNWSSDEETNLMMCKMRQFFKTMIANSQSSKPSTPNMSNRTSPIFPSPSPRARSRCKPPQLVYFENELTRLMKTVPGIRDDQVREIVEYLSSEDTWSDSYDSSDYTSSDLEGTTTKTALQQQISDSCKQIINKFDNIEDEEGDEGDGGIADEKHGVNKETAFVYQKLMASFEKMAAGDNLDKAPSSPNKSPPLIDRVMHHIGSRLVALMHEVSSGESHASNSPKARHYHRRLQQKLSNASSTTTDDDSTSDTNLQDTLSALEDNFSYSVLSRSKSHDLLMSEAKTLHQTGSGDIIVEEREASDCERFSWRGSFESALLATDSRNRLSIIGSEGSASASALAIAAKRRSAGDLIFSHKSLSREQLDRVRSCGSIGGASSEDKLWVSTATRPNRRRSSVPDASCGSGGSADGEDDDDEEIGTSLPRNLQTGAGTTNSLPRLPTNTPPNSMHKAQSHHFLPQNAKSARYRPPGFNRLSTTVPKRAVSAPGLQPTHQRRGRRSQPNVPSESPKRLIKPNADDGITEVDKNHYNISDAREIVENEENLSRDLYISENDVELGDIPRKENIDDEKDSAFSFNEDNASTYTDEISIAGSDVSGKKKKGKKKLINILGIGKKKKNDDGISVGTNSSSLVSSEKIGIPRPNATGVLEHPPEEIQPVLFEKCAIKSQSLQSLGKEVSDEVSTKETQEVLTIEDIANNEDEVDTKMEKISTTKKNGSKIFSIFQSKAKKADDKIEHSGENDYATEGSAQSPIDESELIQIARVIPLGADNSTKKTSQSLTTEKSPETDPNQTAPEKLGDKRKKKFFWRSSSQKDKRRGSNEDEADQTDSSKNTSGKKSFLGKWGSLKRPPNSTSTQHENSPENDSTPEREDAIESITDDVGQSEEVRKKKTLFGTLRLSKKDKSEKSACEHGCRTQCTHLPSLFSACTNSNIRSESERKPSSDSIEVKTIVSYDGESGSRDSSPIRIIRNDFFPDEIHDSDKPCSVDKEENIDEIGEKHVKKQDDEIDDNVGKVEKNIEILENELEGVEKQDVPLSEKQDVPLSEMQDGVINKEDAEEPLDLLKNNEDIDCKISAPVSSMCFQEIPLKNECDTENLKENEVNSENVPLPDGIFRTSCRLSIEGSIQEVDVYGSNHIQERAIHLPESALTSTDTLTQDHIDENIIEKSTETLTEDKFGSVTPEWIDAANAGDIDGSKFNNIYKATLEDFQNIEENSAPVQEENVVTDLEPAENEVKATCDNKIETNDHERRSSCETCGKILEEPEDSVAGQQEIKCVCTTLTKARPSVGDLEEGNVKNKIAAFDQSQLPIIIPLNWVGNKQEPPKKDDVTISEAHSSPTLGSKSGSKSATPSPIAAKSRSGTLSSTNSEWQNAEEDIDRLMVIQGRSSLSSLGLRSDSMASVYSGAGEGRYGTVTVRGHVEFGLQYNYKAGALEIHVKQCKDLAPVDTKRNRSDPYVKVYLLPDKSKGGKRKTKVKKHTLNPVFDETLKFHISLNGLETRTLWLTVWHSDMFGRNDFLGEVMMALENKVFDDPTPKMYSLQERTEPFDDTISFKGDIIVCLKFVPPDMTVQKKGKRSRGTLHVLVKEAKYLTAYKANGTSDPFCKSYLLPDKGRNSKQKTPVVRKTVNPVWNHTFIYDDVTLQELAERCLELTVWDHDRLASNEFLGGVRFSMGTGKHYGKPVEWMDASGKEMTLWKNMLERPNFWVEGCLSLRPTLDARTS